MAVLSLPYRAVVTVMGDSEKYSTSVASNGWVESKRLSDCPSYAKQLDWLLGVSLEKQLSKFLKMSPTESPL